VDQLYSFQNSTGTIGVDNFFSLAPQIITAGLPAGNQPQNISCNNCTKEAYNIILANDPLAFSSSANSSISNQCGASFIGMSLFINMSLGHVVDCWVQMATRLKEYRRLQPKVPFLSRVVREAALATARLDHSRCGMD
jgi:hypothetical protein